MPSQQLLDTITQLSHRYGTVDYVRGGGGNTSAKDPETLWVKPSGTTLAGLTPEKFVAMDRKKLARLYEIEPPTEPAAREELVKNIMAESVLPTSSGRASVEAPLHDTFKARYVVHTHPAPVNGLTCSLRGKSICQTLFPDALWIDYTDPGYTLCIKVRAEIVQYEFKYGHEPELVILENHGIFVAADTPDEIDAIYTRVLETLNAEYEKAHVATLLPVGPDPTLKTTQSLKEAIKAIPVLADFSYVASSGVINATTGPLTPDHMVYAKSYFLTEPPTVEKVSTFIHEHGYPPRVIALENATYGLGESEKSAQLALELALDGALVLQLTQAFGGVNYMTQSAQKFIENWEVESYRKQQQM